jgi:hypothetical protein
VVDSKNPYGRACAQLIVGLCGAWLLVLAARASDSWILSHVVLPNWFLPPTTLRAFHLARAAAALLGLLFVGLLGPRFGRWAGAQSWPKLGARCARIAVALVLALVASEIIVRQWDSHQPFWRKGKLEFRIGRSDPRFGWVLLPSRSTTLKSGRAKAVQYRIDAWGNRARSEVSAPDPALPTLVVSGESIAFGHGLDYEETFPAILGERLGLQVVNVAAGGYGTDQAYLRLVDALDRLEHPVALLTVFLPVQLGRASQDYRPRLVLRDGKLAFEPAATGFWSRWRLRDLLINELPYLSDAALSRAIALNAALVQATALAARARGAETLFLIPSFGPTRALGEHPEASIVRELFEKQRQPYLLIDIDRARIMVDDWHPDAVAARQIAAAVERMLRPRLAP